MSLLGSIGGALKGAIGGFISGGPMGAGMGAVQGAKAYSNRKNKGNGQLAMSRSLVALPSSNTYSASAVTASRGQPATVGQVVRGVGTTLGMWPTTAQVGLAPASGRRNPAGGYDANGWPLKADGKPYKKYRSMNPLNGRAARRAIRRIKGARKMLQQIERQLPKAKARTHTTRRAA